MLFSSSNSSSSSSEDESKLLGYDSERPDTVDKEMAQMQPVNHKSVTTVAIQTDSGIGLFLRSNKLSEVGRMILGDDISCCGSIGKTT